MPVGIVNEDGGKIGVTIIENLLENASDAVKFIEYESVEELKEKQDNREVYGGIVITDNFSEQIATLKTNQPMKSAVTFTLTKVITRLLRQLLRLS